MILTHENHAAPEVVPGQPTNLIEGLPRGWRSPKTTILVIPVRIILEDAHFLKLNEIGPVGQQKEEKGVKYSIFSL